MMKSYAAASVVILSCLASSQVDAAPLYDTYSYYDGFASDDTASWQRTAFAGSIGYDGTNEYISLVESNNDANTRMSAEANVLVQNTLEVGERVAFKIGNIQTSRWSNSTYVSGFLSTDSSGNSTGSQDTWLMLQGGQFGGSLGWSYLNDSGQWTLIDGDVQSIYDRYLEYSRPDSDTVIGTVYSDASLTTEVVTHTYDLTLPASVYVGMFSDNRAGGTYYDDVTIAAIPEPASLTLLAAGAVAMLRRRRSH